MIKTRNKFRKSKSLPDRYLCIYRWSRCPRSKSKSHFQFATVIWIFSLFCVRLLGLCFCLVFSECRRRWSFALKFNIETLSMQMNIATCLCLWPVEMAGREAEAESWKPGSENGISCISRAIYQPRSRRSGGDSRSRSGWSSAVENAWERCPVCKSLFDLKSPASESRTK